MKKSDELHELLYVSTFASGYSTSTVATIAREARTKNKTLDITGLLVFDGERFCQHLEGTLKRVVALYERICLDTRHIKVLLLHEAPLKEKKFLTFSMAYADVVEAAALAQLERLSGQAAAAAFDALCLTLDPQ